MEQRSASGISAGEWVTLDTEMLFSTLLSISIVATFLANQCHFGTLCFFTEMLFSTLSLILATHVDESFIMILDLGYCMVS